MLIQEKAASSAAAANRNTGLSRRQLLGASVLIGAALVPFKRTFAAQKVTKSEGVTPFRIAIPQADLVDLKRRLTATRWPEMETVSDQSQGAQLAKVQALVEYWRTKYDWRRLESRLNKLPQFKTQIDELGIHFFHVKSKHPNALPLIMTHGWPGSVVEFLETIDPLVNPTAHGGTEQDAFHVVLPSLPGYGFSDKPSQKGWDRKRIARGWGQLMKRLGYDRYVAQGGDWGSVVTTEMGRQKLQGLAAIHVNLPFVVPAQLPEKPTSEEKLAIDQVMRFATDGSYYHYLQVTRPQTIGYSLADSPSGQAAWIYEKLSAWSDSNGNTESVFSYDQMLDDIMFYWITNSGASSARMYAENYDLTFNSVPLSLPVAVTVFPGEIFTPPKSWADRTYSDLYYWNRASKGGHFAAFEQPVIFVNELRKAFASKRAT